ncbi:hypothetical protein HXX76_001568 [Chlamydomonas incerta]|uniref:BACK domain-containing protein n=1 Tax=Chlamydomonas incerta TaxID=51695 RepID=A0A835WCI7_CHLIN|nr:hypothetical protein HXX76_001568 [Chlamydomonas incerta]|eukprot:KAG2444826.1 hypothetical protein HXX76_001568 [Chlamydomonas incerta]
MQRSGAGSGLPALRVKLRSADELPAARDALRYCYTGSLASDSFRDLLLVRRIAVEMQISGCEEAADSLMAAWLATGNHDALDLYACDQLFPEEDAAAAAPAMLPTQPTNGAAPAAAAPPPSRFGAVLAAAKRQVLEHFKDAPTVLRSAELQRQALALPARGMLALLESDDFGTDDESSVLLLLARWLEARGHSAQGCGGGAAAGGSGGGGGGGARFPAAGKDVVAQLCRHVRLVNLSACYLTFVLPRIAWFEIDAHQLAFVIRCAATVAAAPHVARYASQLLAGGGGGGNPPATAPPAAAGGGAAAADAAGDAAVVVVCTQQQGKNKMLEYSQFYKTLLDVMGQVYGTATAPWYAMPRRQVLPAGGRAVRWSISSAELLVALRSNQANKTYVATNLHLSDEEGDNGAAAGAEGPGGAAAAAAIAPAARTAASIVIRGMEYSLRLRVVRGGPATAGAYVKCIAPPPFQFLPAGLAVPMARLMVYRWRFGVREVAHVMEMVTEGEALGMHKYYGQQDALPLLATATQTQQPARQMDQDDATPHEGAGGAGGGRGGGGGGRRQAGDAAQSELAGWAEYLHDGCVQGALLLLPGHPALV